MKDIRRIRVLATLGVVLLALIPVCTRIDRPYIWRLRGDTLVNALDSAEYECRAWTPGKQGVVYSWEVSRGRLAWDYDSLVKWYTPETSGSVVMRLTAVNEWDLTDRDSLMIEVSPVTRTVLSYDGGVKALSYREWRDSLRAGYLLDGDFRVDTNTVSFFILDSTDRARWARNDSFHGLVSARLTEADSFEVVVRNTGWYSMIVDNRHGKIEKGFRVRVYKTTPVPDSEPGAGPVK
ncbi:MAG: hypothetical protein JSU73_10345 [candidate division WOR-3 bacterium]|nr:MAG: hypothetical protein JSU73_10345 [candidate division WOR-3 bacterium]